MLRTPNDSCICGNWFEKNVQKWLNYLVLSKSTSEIDKFNNEFRETDLYSNLLNSISILNEKLTIVIN